MANCELAGWSRDFVVMNYEMQCDSQFGDKINVDQNWSKKWLVQYDTTTLCVLNIAQFLSPPCSMIRAMLVAEETTTGHTESQRRPEKMATLIFQNICRDLNCPN